MKPRGLGRIYRRGNVWWLEYWFRGRQYRESSDDRSENGTKAARLLKKRLGEIGRGRLIGPDAERLTFDDLARLVGEDYRLNARKSTPPLARLREYFGPHTRALDITPEAVTRYIEHRREAGAAAATVKNEVAALGRAFTLAYRSGRLPNRPFLPSVRVSNARSGFFTDEEVARLITYLPSYMRPFVEAAYITGWRRGELRSLKWVQVDWEAGTIRLERGTTKSGEPRSLPFAAHPRLAALLGEQKQRTRAFEQASGEICPWVFHRDGHQVCWYYDGWRTACRRAGVPGRLFHDLRRSAVRNLIRAGVSERVAMTITGHKTRSVFDRYHIVAGADQVEAIRKLAALQGQSEPRLGRKVVALAAEVSGETRTVPAQSGRSRRPPDPQLPATLGRNVASPTGFESADAPEPSAGNEDRPRDPSEFPDILDADSDQ